MSDIKEVYMNDERIFMKKKFGRWKVVYPSKVDGKIHWRNFLAGSSWWNLLWIAIVVGIIIGCIYEYSIAIKTANTCLEQLKIPLV